MRHTIHSLSGPNEANICCVQPQAAEKCGSEYQLRSRRPRFVESSLHIQDRGVLVQPGHMGEYELVCGVQHLHGNEQCPRCIVSDWTVQYVPSPPGL